MSLKVMGKCAMEVILFDRCRHTMIVTAPKMHWGCLDRPTVVIYSRPMDKRFCNHDICDMYLRLVCVCVVLWMVGCRLSGVVRPASADAASNFTTSRFTNTKARSNVSAVVLQMVVGVSDISYNSSRVMQR